MSGTSPFPMSDPLVPATILGQDDWLIFGRTAGGTLVYTAIETDWHWLAAPHRGDCRSETTMINCDGETKVTCRRDSAWMQDYISAHRGDYHWRECDYDPVSGEYLGWPESQDTEFTIRAAETYLPGGRPLRSQCAEANQAHVRAVMRERRPELARIIEAALASL